MIKAIETSYEGYKFRSRLEARWAVFFDALGLPWEYEKEGIDLGELGCYLPDFWFPTLRVWAEVKPGKFSLIEYEKCSMLSESCILLDGMPEARHYYLIRDDEGKASLGPSSVSEYMAGEWLSGVDLGMSAHKGRLWYSFGSTITFDSDFDQAAVNKARSARFEHGEKPG